MEIIHFVKLVLRWWWLIGLGGLIGGTIAFIALQKVTPVYAASSIFTVTLRSNAFSEDDQEVLKITYQQLLYQRPVLENVIRNLGLDMGVGQLQKNVRVVSEVGSRLIKVTVEDTEAQRAPLIANELVKVLMRDGRSILGYERIVRRATVQVVEVAQPSNSPVRPQKRQIIVLAVFAASVLTIGAVGIKEFLDTTVRSAAHVEAAMDAQTLITLPNQGATHWFGKRKTVTELYLRVLETYRLLRARIDYAARGKPISIVVTSSNAHEGKTTVSVHLAFALAEAGQRVILVDTDLRRPKLHTLFGQDNRQGVTTLLSEHPERSVSDYLLPTGKEHVRLLASGPVQGAEPVSLHGIQGLIEQLKQHADVVIFDSSPLLGVADGLLLGQACDMTLLVVRAGFTRMEDLIQVARLFTGFDIHPFGVVLNRVGKGQSTLYGAYDERPYKGQGQAGRETWAMYQAALSAPGKRGLGDSAARSQLAQVPKAGDPRANGLVADEQNVE